MVYDRLNLQVLIPETFKYCLDNDISLMVHEDIANNNLALRFAKNENKLVIDLDAFFLISLKEGATYSDFDISILKRVKELLPSDAVDGNAIEIPSSHVRKYLEIFGEDELQLDILQEECAELIQAISKYKRNLKKQGIGNTRTDPKQNIVEELTHVAISSEIAAKILGISKEDIQKEVQRKAEKFGVS